MIAGPNALRPITELPERQISDLAFPFARAAAFRKQENVVNSRAHRNLTADFEHSGHWLALHGAAIGLGCNSRHIVSKQHSILFRSPRQERSVVHSCQA